MQAPDVHGNGSPSHGSQRGRIALLLESDGPGGAEIMLIQTAEELRRRGYEVIPVGPAAGCGWLREQLESRGFDYETFTLRRPLDWGCVQGLLELVERRRIDVLHSHEFTMAVYSAATAAIRGITHVSTMHGSSRMLSKWTRRLALRLAFRKTRVVAVSGDTQQHLETTLGLRKGVVRTIRNGIRAVRGSRQRVRQELGLEPSDLLIVAVGNLVPRKGHLHLLRALSRLDEEAVPRNWHVAIAGRGERRDELAAFAREAGFSDRVHLLGHRDDIPDILAAADIYAMPSLWEGLPVALLEAMFAGKPIIASAVSGIPEAIGAGEHGILTAPGDEIAIAGALRQLLSDASLRETLGDAARRRASEAYSVEGMVDQYERVYGFRP